jgi:hypothetical protein
MLSKSQILRDVYSVLYPLSSLVSNDLYRVLKTFDEYLGTYKSEAVELTLYSNSEKGTKPLGQSFHSDTD